MARSQFSLEAMRLLISPWARTLRRSPAHALSGIVWWSLCLLPAYAQQRFQYGNDGCLVFNDKTAEARTHHLSEYMCSSEILREILSNSPTSAVQPIPRHMDQSRFSDEDPIRYFDYRGIKMFFGAARLVSTENNAIMRIEINQSNRLKSLKCLFAAKETQFRRTFFHTVEEIGTSNTKLRIEAEYWFATIEFAKSELQIIDINCVR